MCISVIVNLSAESYRLKTLQLMLSSLDKQTAKDFEVVIVNHDLEDNTSKVKEIVGERDYPVLLSFFQREEGYLLNPSRNEGHKVATRLWHLVVDCDLVFPSNFIEVVLSYLGIEKNPGHKLDIFTFPHASTLGQSNNRTNEAVFDETPDFVTEEDLDNIDLDRVLQKAKEYLIRTRQSVPGMAHRGYSQFNRFPTQKECVEDEVAYFWNHPVTRIEHNYRPNEMFFIIHRDLIEAFGYWPTSSGLQNRGPDKLIMNQIIYYMHDRAVSTLHTLMDTFIVHIEHPRPYNMKSHPGAERMREAVGTHDFMKPIMNKVNDLWLREKEKWDARRFR